MADSALSTDPLERYGAIERTYCEENWSAVIHDGQAMLADLSHADAVPPEGLKERLQLLIAHSFLYGLGDRDSAEDLYQAVLRSGAEVSLRQIAEQGLQQCALPGAAPESQEEEKEKEQEQEDSPSGPPASLDAGMSGWPEADAVASPAEPTVASQPAAVSAPQEGSAPSQGLQDSWGSAAASLPSEASSEGSWWTTEPTSAPQGQQDSAALPVMPWLESDAVEAAATSLRPQQPIHAEESPFRHEEPLEPEPASLAPREDQPQTPLMAALVEAGAVPEADRLDAPPLSAASPDVALTSSEGLDASPPSPPEGAAEEKLFADVVEEPELIELYQAEGPALEELLVHPVAEASVASAVAGVDTQAPPDAEAPRPAGDDRCVSDSAPSEVLNRGAEPEPAPEPDPQEEPLPSSPRIPVASGMRPFSAPPEPVAEEDPELLMGLLKVEMG